MKPGGTMHSPIEISKNHPAFAGHFPKFPVLPGAVLLDEALQVIQDQRGIDLADWQVAVAKFLDIVRPGDALSLEHAVAKAGLIRFTIFAANRTVVSGDLSRAARSDPTQPGGTE